jgi:hypothetical protein
MTTFVPTQSLAHATRRLWLPVAITVALLVIGSWGAAAAHAEGWKQTIQIFRINHSSVAMSLVTAPPAGHSLGDLRVLPATPIYDVNGVAIGRLDAQMVTTSIDYPRIGDEIRMTNLNFNFGQPAGNAAGSPHSLLVSGSGVYATVHSTLPTGAVLVRAITGGTGAFTGAQGYAESEHLHDGSWWHTFHISGVSVRLAPELFRP